MIDWHSKPPPEVRTVGDAMRSAEQRRKELPHVVQVYARDWDTVILTDEIERLRTLIKTGTELTMSKAK